MVIYSFKTNINKLLYLYTLRCDHQRCDKLSLFTIHTLILYTTSLYFSASRFKWMLNSNDGDQKWFHNLRNYRCSYRWRSRNVFLRNFLRKLWNWFLHYWNDENLLYPFSLHVLFANLFLLMKNAKIICSELFDVLQYIRIWQNRDNGLKEGKGHH